MEVSSLRLDAYTLVFSISMLALFMAAVSFILGSGGPRHRSGLNDWGKAMACVHAHACSKLRATPKHHYRHSVRYE